MGNMIDQLETLRALRDTGTMGQAAARLRITQSAVSKRIAALEAQVGVALIARAGRRVRLTPDAERLLEDAEPLLAQLRDVLAARSPSGPMALRVAGSESLLASWLPEVLRGAVDAVGGVGIELHAHRGPILRERVRAGDYALAIAADAVDAEDLVSVRLGREPMVIVRAEQGCAEGGPWRVWTIEPRSLTWELLEPQLRRREGIEVVGRLESFAALVQVARAGFGDALVPLGVARTMGVPPTQLVPTSLARPIGAIARRTTMERGPVRALVEALRERFPPFAV